MPSQMPGTSRGITVLAKGWDETSDEFGEVSDTREREQPCSQRRFHGYLSTASLIRQILIQISCHPL
jgi:hypothetical protein